jgi:peptidoglycan/xylan/chitin deacetylase (PgdA/CDA1 family)
MPQLDAAAQKLQICGNGDRFAQVFGVKPTLFRPPYGEYNATTQQMAAQCGIKALVNWSVTVDNGQLNYQAPHQQLQPGDIVLLHFTPNLHTDVAALFAAADAAHLQFGRLEDWLH